MYFWQALPNFLHNTGFVCLAVAGIHAISALASHGKWLVALLETLGHFFKQSAQSIRDFIAETWDFFKDDPWNTGFGCLFIVVFVFFLGGILSVFIDGAWVSFFDQIDSFLEYLIEYEPADEIFIVELFLFSPLLVLFFLFLIGVVWAVLALAGKSLSTYAQFTSQPTPQRGQWLASIVILLAGFGMLASSGWVQPYANNQVSEIRKGHLLRGDLRRFDLQNLNLSGIDLRDADLSGANLSGSCLIGANLRNANLQDAKLSGAWLDHSDLSHAKLKKADLQSASLKYAILDNAFFWETNLRDADLRYASSKGGGPSRTTLPDGEQTYIGDNLWGFLRFERFTDPEHPKFWTPETLPLPPACQNALDY